MFMIIIMGGKLEHTALDKFLVELVLGGINRRCVLFGVEHMSWSVFVQL